MAKGSFSSKDLDMSRLDSLIDKIGKGVEKLENLSGELEDVGDKINKTKINIPINKSSVNEFENYVKKISKSYKQLSEIDFNTAKIKRRKSEIDYSKDFGRIKGVEDFKDRLQKEREQLLNEVNEFYASIETIKSSYNSTSKDAIDISEMFDPKKVDDSYKKLLKDINKNGSKLDDAQISMIKRIEELYDAFENAQKKYKELKDGLSDNLTDQSGIKDFLNFGSKLIKIAKEIEESAQKIGVSVEKYSKISFVNVLKKINQDADKMRQESINSVWKEQMDDMHKSMSDFMAHVSNFVIDNTDLDGLTDFMKNYTSQTKTATKVTKKFNEEVKNVSRYINPNIKTLNGLKHKKDNGVFGVYDAVLRISKMSSGKTDKEFQQYLKKTVSEKQETSDGDYQYVGEMANLLKNTGDKFKYHPSVQYYKELIHQKPELKALADAIMDVKVASTNMQDVISQSSDISIVDKEDVKNIQDANKALEEKNNLIDEGIKKASNFEKIIKNIDDILSSANTKTKAKDIFIRAYDDLDKYIGEGLDGKSYTDKGTQAELFYYKAYQNVLKNGSKADLSKYTYKELGDLPKESELTEIITELEDRFRLFADVYEYIHSVNSEFLKDGLNIALLEGFLTGVDKIRREKYNIESGYGNNYEKDYFQLLVNQVLSDEKYIGKLLNVGQDFPVAFKVVPKIDVDELWNNVGTTIEDAIEDIPEIKTDVSNKKVVAISDSNEELKRQYEIEKSRLDDLLKYEKENDAAIERLEKKQTSRHYYAKEKYGNDRMFVYDKNQIEIAKAIFGNGHYFSSSDYDLPVLKNTRVTQKTYDESFNTIVKLISDAYMGEYGIFQGLEKDINSVINPYLGKYVNGIKGFKSKDIQNDFKNLLLHLTSQFRLALRSDGEDSVIEDIIEPLKTEAKNLYATQTYLAEAIDHQRYVVSQSKEAYDPIFPTKSHKPVKGQDSPIVEQQEKLEQIVDEVNDKLEKQNEIANKKSVKSLYERAQDFIYEVDMTDYDPDDWEYSKDSLYRREKQIADLRKRIKTATDTGIIDSLNKELDDLSVEFVAIYSRMCEDFPDMIDKKRGIRKSAKNLYQSLAPQSDIDEYEKPYIEKREEQYKRIKEQQEKLNQSKQEELTLTKQIVNESNKKSIPVSQETTSEIVEKIIEEVERAQTVKQEDTRRKLRLGSIEGKYINTGKKRSTLLPVLPETEHESNIVSAPTLLVEERPVVIPDVKNQIEESTESLKQEEKAFEKVAEAATEAAVAKKDFDNANKKVKKGAKESAKDIHEEVKQMQEVSESMEKNEILAKNQTELYRKDSERIKTDRDNNNTNLPSTILHKLHNIDDDYYDFYPIGEYIGEDNNDEKIPHPRDIRKDFWSNTRWERSYIDDLGRNIKIGEVLNKRTQMWESTYSEVTDFVKLEKEAIEAENKLNIALADLYMERRLPENKQDNRVKGALQDQVLYYEAQRTAIRNRAAQLAELDSEYSVELFEQKVEEGLQPLELNLMTKTSKHIRKQNQSNQRTLEKERNEAKVKSFNATVDKFIANLNNQLLGRANELEGFDQLQHIASVEQIDAMSNIMTNLQEQLNKLSEFARKGTSSLNPLTNALNNKNNLHSKVELLNKQFYNKISGSSAELDDAMIAMWGADEKLQNAHGIKEETKAYGELRVAINNVTNALRIQIEAEKEAQKATNQSEKNILSQQKNNQIKDKINAFKTSLSENEAKVLTSNGVSVEDELNILLLDLDKDISNTVRLIIKNKFEALKNPIENARKEAEKQAKEDNDKILKDANAYLAKTKELDKLYSSLQAELKKQASDPNYNERLINIIKNDIDTVESERDAIGKFEDVIKANKNIIGDELYEDIRSANNRMYTSRDNANKLPQQLKADAARKENLKNITDEYEKQISLVKELSSAYSELNKLQSLRSKATDSNVFQKYTNDIDSTIKRIDTLEERVQAFLKSGFLSKNADVLDLDKYFKEYNAYAGGKDSIVSKYNDNLSEALQKVYKAYGSSQLKLMTMHKNKNFTFFDFEKEVERMQNFRQMYDVLVKEVQNTPGLSVKNIIGDLDTEFKQLSEHLALDNFKLLNGQVDNFISSLKHTGSITNLFKTQMNDLRQEMSDLNSEFLNGSISIEDYGRKVSDIFDKYKRHSSLAKDDGIFKDAISSEAILSDLEKTTNKIPEFYTKLNEYQNKIESIMQSGSTDSAQQMQKLFEDIQLFKKNSKAYDISNSKGDIVSVGNIKNINDAKNALKDYASRLGYTKEISHATTQTTDSMTMKFRDINGNVITLKGSIESFNDSLRVTQSVAKGAGGFLGNLGITFKELGNVFTMYFSMHDIFRYLINGFNSGKEALLTYDAAMTNMSYTMDLTQDQFRDLGLSAVEMANDLSTSLENAMDIYAIYANMQTTPEEINAIAKPTAILSNLAAIDTTTASDQIQGILQQFNMLKDESVTAVDASMHVVDVLNSISSNVAIDNVKAMEIMSDAVQAAGQVAYDAGLSYEQLAAVTAKVAERTREDGSTIGNAIKTIVTRISKVGKMPSYADEVSNEELSNASASLHEIGVEVYNVDGSFRELDVILGELEEKWDSLTDAQKSNISYNVAATRQTSKFKNMLEAWTDAMELAEEATTSQGLALQNQAKYEESYSGKIQKIKTQWQEFWLVLLNSQQTKDVLDFVSDFTSKIIEMEKALGPIPTILTTIFGIISARTGFGMLKDFIKNGGIQNAVG